LVASYVRARGVLTTLSGVPWVRLVGVGTRGEESHTQLDLVFVFPALHRATYYGQPLSLGSFR